MCPNRTERQYRLACEQEDDKLLIGSKYKRIPEGLTDRYTLWANQMTQERLYTQVNLFPSFVSQRRENSDLSGTRSVVDHAHVVLCPIVVRSTRWL